MESQSRYSIIERLTNKKLELMDELTNIDADLISKEQDILDSKQRLSDYELQDKEEAKEERLRLNRAIKQFELKLKQAKIVKTKKAENLKKKILEVDKGLKQLEEISKMAPTPQEQS